MTGRARVTTEAQMNLRPYQDEAVDRTRSALVRVRAFDKTKPARILTVLPTGAGKTVIAASIVASAVKRNRRVVVLTHRREIARQWVEKLAAAGVEAGLICGADTRDTDRRVVVAMVQSVTARGESPDAEIVIVDEAHHNAASTWGRVTAAYPEAEAIIGLTATPEREDGKGLGANYDEMAVGAYVDDLVRDGWLLGCKVISPGKAQKDLAQDPADAYADHCVGRRAIVFAANVEHSQKIAADLVARGVRAQHVDGETPEAERDAAIAAFRAGELDVLTNVMLFAEGTDAPGCSAVIWARGVGSAGLWLQGCGRAMRPRKGRAEPGEHAVIVDLRGSVWPMGHPCERRAFTLEHGITRYSDRASLRQCPKCGAVAPYSGPVCDVCGADFPKRDAPKVKRAKLDEVTEAARKADFANKGAYYKRLCREARTYHMSREWVARAFRLKWGHDVPQSFWKWRDAPPEKPGEAIEVTRRGAAEVLREVFNAEAAR